MAERQRIALPFGEGLDRETGAMAVRPGSIEDQRNVILFAGKAQVRRGFASRAQLTAPGSGNPLLLLNGCPLRTARMGVVVGYNAADRKVHVFRVDSTGANPVHVGEWFTLHEDASIEPPVISMVDTRGRVFMAHDEPLLGQTGAFFRAPTFVYEPAAAAPLYSLDEDLDDDGSAAPVRFRGVARHMKYLIGWGWGTESDPDMPEIVRVSYPGLADPEIGSTARFDPNHYWRLGQWGEPVVACGVAGAPGGSRDGALIAFKETEFYALVGQHWGNFGEDVTDARFGALGSRFTVEWNGLLFFWSPEGPRVTDGGPSRSLHIPLDLSGPSPATLVAAGDVAHGFATWVPDQQVILFVFGRRVYALSIRGEPWKWAYWELGFEATCGFHLYDAAQLPSGTVTPPDEPVAGSYPQYISGSATSTSVKPIWVNVNATGVELVEVWVKAASASEYTHAGTVAASALTLVVTDGVVAGEAHDIALRYRIGADGYHEDYTDPDPANWPAISRGTIGAVTLANPGLITAVWRRTSANTTEIVVTVNITEPGASTEIRRGGVLVETLDPGETEFIDTGFTADANNAYDARHVAGSDESDYSQVTNCWGGPNGLLVTEYGSHTVDEWWLTGTVTLETWTVTPGGTVPVHRVEIEASNETDDPGVFTQYIDELVGAGPFLFDQSHPGEGGDDYELRARIVVQSYGVEDFGPWIDGLTLTLRAAGP